MNERSRPLWLRGLGMLPKAVLSRWAAGCARRGWSRHLIAPFARHYDVAMDQAFVPSAGFASLAAFFGRELKPGLRPIDLRPGAIVAPCDGCLGVCGRIHADTLVQAKGREYSAAALLADAERARAFSGGCYLTVYLAPRDYHRVHAPVAGGIVHARYIPGLHWPVNATAVAHIPNLFAGNERLVTYVQSATGLVAVVMVGACIVGGLRVNYDGALDRADSERDFAPPLPIARGDELGRFEFGSTVVLLIAGAARLADAGRRPVRMGEIIAWEPGAEPRPAVEKIQ